MSVSRVSYRSIAASLLALGWLALLPLVQRHVQAAGPQEPPSTSAALTSAESGALLDRYCVTCHNDRQKSRGAVPTSFEGLDLTRVSANAAILEKVVQKLSAGLMPPPAARRPDRTVLDNFQSWLEFELDRSAAADPNPGRTAAFHRLNRAEYQNAIRDLLHLEVDVTSLLPADDSSYGFDNIAGVLKMSPTLMERYLSVAQKISRMAIGAPPPFPNADFFQLPEDLPQDDHIEGLPFGTRGGTVIRYTFPMDAEYVIKLKLSRDLNDDMPFFTDAQQLELALDGERLRLFELPIVQPPPSQQRQQQPSQSPQQPTPTQPRQQQDVQRRQREKELRNHADDNWEIRIPVKAGEHDVSAAFVKKTSALAETVRLPFLRPYQGGTDAVDSRMGAALRLVEIRGPFSPTGPGDTESRRRIFACHPATSSQEYGCAKTILSTLARRAYRRPVTDADLKPLLAMYTNGHGKGGFEAGIERALKLLLVSPGFLYRIERDPVGIAPNTVYRVSNIELASRLSFFLWSSIPDDELLDTAVRGQLQDPVVLTREVRRMIADDRFEAFVKEFAGQWLFLRNVPAAAPVQTVFPDFDDGLRQALQRETELFFQSIVREDRGALELLTANYTFLNERLARHYGIPNVKGSHFRRITLGEHNQRAGVLGQGSMLAVTSYPNRTSPVLRGKWILDNLLGSPPPPPPPNVPELKPTNAAGSVLSMRDRMAQHRANPVCASCHSVMDPLGLSLENFDGVGRSRTLGESSAPIDASGVFPDGTKFDGPTGLRQALLSRSDRFVTVLTDKLMTYALGRGLEYYDAPAVRAIVRKAARNDYRFSTSLIEGVVQSAPFQMRKSLP